MNRAIFVAIGPGARFVAPRRSRNSSRVIQLRRVTTSLSIIEMWAAGPPKAVAPRRRKSAARSLKGPEERSIGRHYGPLEVDGEFGHEPPRRRHVELCVSD